MAKVLIKAATGDIVAVIPDSFDFGNKETLVRGFWRLQIIDLTKEDMMVFMVNEYELVHYYDGAMYIGDAYVWFGNFVRWYFDFSDAPAAYTTTLNSGVTLQITANQANFYGVLRNKTDGRKVTPADFNSADTSAIRERDDDVRNFPGAPDPPEEGGDLQTWQEFLNYIASGKHDVRTKIV